MSETYSNMQSVDTELISTINELGSGGSGGKDEIYIGSGEMPEGYVLQIDPNGSAITIPTKTSQLENDSGYITQSDLPNKSILDLISAVDGKLQYNGSDVGLKGDKGDTPNIQIGTVETLPAESPATASMTGTPESPLLNLGIPQGASGSGISVTGATVGQTVRIAAVDENGVPTAWEAVDMPNEEWVELVNATVNETSIPILDLGDYAVNFRKIRFFICAEAMTPTLVTFALSISNTTTGTAYNFCSITNFGNESAVSKAIIDFEPLIKDGFCRVSYSWAVPPTTSVKTSNILYQYNSYDYYRLRTARYFRPNLEFPAGTTITIEGVRK